MTRVVLAPDSFKGSLPATEVAAALSRGWRAVRPHDDVVEVPLADGGEGTLDAFERAVPGAVRHGAEVQGPDGRPVAASWLALPDGTAVVELACASGLTLLGSPLPLDAHTRGVGEVVRAALAAGPRRLVVALGGSASTDGGAGLLRALGARVLDDDGEPVPDGGRGLARVASVDLTDLPALPPDGVDVLCDVTNPLLGRSGAAAVFAPQKGATPDDVVLLDDALGRWAEALGRAASRVADVPRGTSGTVPDGMTVRPDDHEGRDGRGMLPSLDPSLPGAGAAGGTAFGLLAWGARLVPGSVAVADVVGLDALLDGADLVVTGEGRLDAQSAAGKAPAEVARRAVRAGVRLALVVGSAEQGTTAALGAHAEPPDVVELAHLAGSAEASLADPVRWLEVAGAHLAQRLA
ncbi:glycerate kinase [Sanguibacter sp. HDW7]|uniref:glycerate kinase n=1 Tax=Sanguibacter sp. HDW7 TaxID=2714931 RepID=UPI00140B1D97|nr:glycerate kinase [Sanguibacter sp. HDW7]QIK84642.1 glycerate kinase [Sanguibacter sp. HDW7]